ncbi:MAG: hypothetical protein HRT57_18065 [Crocinitomicaceae bacterium]|nr:hypothetical protein [Crocinitomicaceae bacterium]
MKVELLSEKERSIIIENDLEGDFSYTLKWDYPLGVYTNRHGQVSCDGFCQEGAHELKDDQGRIPEDSAAVFYALVDTTHEFHSLNSEAQQYEWGQSNQMRFVDHGDYRFTGMSTCNAGTHSGLNIHLDVMRKTFIASVDFTSITPKPRQHFQLKKGILVLDEDPLAKKISKVNSTLPLRIL